MNGHARTIADFGAEGHLIEVECHLSNGLPGIVIVGMANRATDEAKERIRSAFASARLELPRKRIIINLAPADLPKDGSGFDVAIAAAILTAAGKIPALPPTSAFVGELALDGLLRPVRGIIGKALSAKAANITTFYLPVANMDQARLVPGLTFQGIHSLADFARHLQGAPLPRSPKARLQRQKGTHANILENFDQIIGQEQAKRALEIAAAGHHNILLNGSPGAGKSMLAKAVVGILPPLSAQEILTVTHLHSLAGRHIESVVRQRPFRSPHHSASTIALIGGGAQPRPGEISLSHTGALFLDEFPEFSRSAIEALRQPLEDKIITIARAHTAVTFPADFMLIATRNPCPCGYYGSSRACTCTVADLTRYEQRLSGPILDRIDIHITVDGVDHSQLLETYQGTSKRESSKTIQQRVIAARQLQHKRFKDPLKTNASMNNTEVKQLVRLEPAAKTLLDSAGSRLELSARAYMRCVRVARTIADLDASSVITRSHIAEALQYRRATPVNETSVLTSGNPSVRISKKLSVENG